MRSLIILLTVLFAAVFLSASSLNLPLPPPVPSEWKPIKDLKGVEVTAVAEAAVKQFNGKLPAGSKGHLTLQSVENGDVKVLADGKTVYRFHLKAYTNGKVQVYEVVVGVADAKTGEKMKQLLAFLPVLN